MTKKIAIIDYGVGNLASVSKALDYIGAASEITRDPDVIRRACGVLLPGVGAFADAADRLVQCGLVPILRGAAQEKPLLGICLGMQLLFDESSEMRPTRGLSLIPGRVELIKTDCKLPHIGWNALEMRTPCALTAGMGDGEHVYFVHSFMACAQDARDVAAITHYGAPVTAMCARGHVFGCQFHPEKSGDAGLTILRNFAAIL